MVESIIGFLIFVVVIYSLVVNFGHILMWIGIGLACLIGIVIIGWIIYKIRENHVLRKFYGEPTSSSSSPLIDIFYKWKNQSKTKYVDVKSGEEEFVAGPAPEGTREILILGWDKYGRAYPLPLTTEIIPSGLDPEIMSTKNLFAKASKSSENIWKWDTKIDKSKFYDETGYYSYEQLEFLYSLNFDKIDFWEIWEDLDRPCVNYELNPAKLFFGTNTWPDDVPEWSFWHIGFSDDDSKLNVSHRSSSEWIEGYIKWREENQDPIFEAYELLGIDPNINISVPQIKALRRKMAKQHHPDKNLQVNTNERMTEINNACDFLIEHKQNEKNKE